MLNLQDLQRDGTNVQIVIGLNDLVSAIRQIVKDERSRIVMESDEKDNGYYTREQAAKILHVHIRTLDSSIKNGIIKAEKIGRRILIPKKQITRIQPITNF